MCRVLLGLIINLSLAGGSSSACVLRAVCGLLNFLYLAQLPSQTHDMVSHLECLLVTFHKNKDIFIDLGVQRHFNTPKFHSLLHYSLSILLFGTTDNYNTKQTGGLLEPRPLPGASFPMVEKHGKEGKNHEHDVPQYIAHTRVTTTHHLEPHGAPICHI